MSSGYEAVAAVAQVPLQQQGLADPQAVDLSLTAERAEVNRGAYADLRDPAVVASQDLAHGWAGLAQSVLQGTNGGIVAPHMQRLEAALQRRIDDPSAAPPAEMMLLALQVQNASAVSHMLSSSVSTVRKTVQTLVERTG